MLIISGTLRDGYPHKEPEVMILEAVAGNTPIEGMTKAAEEYQKKYNQILGSLENTTNKPEN